LPDFIQVYLKPLKLCVDESFVHALPGEGDAAWLVAGT
jgi:hypothetical protein